MARTSWFVGGVKRKIKNSRKRIASNCSTSIFDFDSDADDMYFLGAGLNFVDPDQERDPPPPATQVTFPAYGDLQNTRWTTQQSLPDFQQTFSRILKPADITKEHAKALNIDIRSVSSTEELLPSAQDGTSYLPPLTPQQAITATSYAEATKADPNVSRKRKDFDDRLTELRCDNDTAYRTLSRSLRNGSRGPKLAYLREFYEGLESMSRYWETSADDYFELPPSPAASEKGVKRQRLDSNKADFDNEQENVDPAVEKRASTSSVLSGLVSSGRADSRNKSDRDIRSETASPKPRSRQRYKGRRTNTGREVPDQFRVDTVKAFVEATVWPFQCSVAAPRVMPVVQFGKLNLPVRQTAAVYRLPKDRASARQGRLEGPMLAVQVRADTDFTGGDGQPMEAKSRLDLMRELGGLLQLAQERRREGKKEVKPGEGQWWTIKPRWGGGRGGEVAQDEGNSDVLQAAEELLDCIKAQKAGKPKGEGRARQRKTPALLWQELKCGSGFWDPKTDYAAIGKTPSSPWDEVFMVSSLNHHISILKLTVHMAYVDYLITGKAPAEMPEDAAWCRPRLQRSRWYDLFDVEQRVEAFRGLWGVIGFLTRNLDASGGGEDAEMSGTTE